MFADLPAEAQAAIRAKQAAKKRARRQQARQRAQAAQAAHAAQAAQAAQAAAQDEASGDAAAAWGFPSVITMAQYFAGAPGGLFKHPMIKASLVSLAFSLPHSAV